MAACRRCGGQLEATFRFCPWCAAPQRQKIVEFFRPHARDAGRALRVSRYYGEEPQVRFSVWEDGVAQAAVSVDEQEARRLARFLEVTADPSPGITGRLLDAARRIGATASGRRALGPA